MRASVALTDDLEIPWKAARPLLKWAGGKTQLLSEISSRLPPQVINSEVSRYIEPFVGGGAVFFYLAAIRPGIESVLIDVNAELINLYRVAKADPDGLLERLAALETQYHRLDVAGRADMFYAVRERYNKLKSAAKARVRPHIALAADMVFLNRTCFNGLYRLNSKGGFNVPHGRYAKPTIADVDNVNAVHEALQGVELVVGDYQESRKYIRQRTFLYFDPPYRPLSSTSGFVSYDKNGFNDDDQRTLAGYFRKCSQRKQVYLMLSNSDPKVANPKDNFFDELYSEFTISRVNASRNINSNGRGRGAVSEILVTNYGS